MFSLTTFIQKQRKNNCILTNKIQKKKLAKISR